MGQPRAVLTVDVELWTWRGDYELDVEKPVETLLGLAKRYEVPITFFVSLSDKGLGRTSDGDYLARTQRLVSHIAESDWSDVAVHTHCRNLPVGFPTPDDEISAYAADACAELIEWNVAQITRASGRPPCAHRAANFSLPSVDPLGFYDLLSRFGLLVDSSDISIPFSGPKEVRTVLEMPPATTTYMGARHKVWSPDTMTIDEMLELASQGVKESDTLVMNSHSFMFGAPAHHRPDQPLFRTWFGLPPAVQDVLRPPLRIVKRIARSRRPSAGPAGVSSVTERLSQLVQRLGDDGWGFTDFRSILAEGARS